MLPRPSSTVEVQQKEILFKILDIQNTRPSRYLLILEALGGLAKNTVPLSVLACWCKLDGIVD